MIRFTVDTNIYISSFNFGGVPKEVLSLALKEKARLSVSVPILQEIARILHDKFSWSEFDIRETEADILSYAELVTPTERIEAVRDDPPTIVFLNAPPRAARSTLSPGTSTCYGSVSSAKHGSCPLPSSSQSQLRPPAPHP